MGRIRSIKPEFPHSENMGRVSRDARLLFIMLFTLADDEGRGRASSRMLASLLFPYDDDAKTHIVQWLFELEREGTIRLYEANGNAYFQIEKWLEHQKIDKPSKSKIPAPVDKPREHSPSPREASTTDQGSRIKEGIVVLPEKIGPQKLYPDDFQKFWDEYPTDPNMPKKKALEAWRKLSPEKRAQAQAAIPAFKRYCEQNKSWYRTIYADRFLAQEKFEGYAGEKTPSPEDIAADLDKADRLLKRGKYAETYQ